MPLKLFKNSVKATSQLDHERLSSLINSMADAVIALNTRGLVVMYNSAALNILDVNTIAQEESIKQLLRPIDKDNQPVDIESLIDSAGRPVSSRDLRLKYNDGSLINLYISIAPVKLGYREKGQQGYIMLLRDITREKSIEEERDEFISVVSHELRTPIAIAEGNISNAMFIAGKQSTNPDVVQALEESHRQVLFLSDMINDLSMLSRAERGVLSVESNDIDIKQLIEQIANSYKDQASEQGLEIIVKVDPKVGSVHTSPLYVNEIIQNFITNALKYTHKGHIKIKVTPAASGVNIAVSDTGIGIGKPDQARVFDKFFRSEDYRTRQSSGTGLGLYVTFKLARLIHAKLSLESELDKGSTFTVFIPNI